MKDVAWRAGVSKNTVSLALRGSRRVSEETRRRVEAAAADLNYRGNPAVAELMAELRRSGSGRYRATLGLLNANEDRDAFRRHPTIPTYVEGCKRRAGELGFGLNEFWLHDPAMDGERMVGILRARGIRGLLVVGLMRSKRLPERMAALWGAFPVVVTGVRTRGPELSFACADHHALALSAFEKVTELGYRRPGLVLDPVIDELIEGRFTAGYLMAQRQLGGGGPSPFAAIAEARDDLGVFEAWLEREQPDLLFTLYHEVARWLKALGRRIPDDIGLVQYEWRADHREWAGMDQCNDQVGEAAVDMLVSMLHGGATGVPEHPRATMVASQWVEGETVRRCDAGCPES